MKLTAEPHYIIFETENKREFALRTKNTYSRILHTTLRRLLIKANGRRCYYRWKFTTYGALELFVIKDEGVYDKSSLLVKCKRSENGRIISYSDSDGNNWEEEWGVEFPFRNSLIVFEKKAKAMEEEFMLNYIDFFKGF